MERQKRQRDLIRAFDQEIISYQPFGLPREWSTGFWGFWSVFLMIVPYQALQDKEWNMVWLFLITFSIMSPFNCLYYCRYIREQGRWVPFYQKIKYLPVDIRQVRLVRIGYLLQFLKKTLAVSMLLQSVGTLLIYHTLSIWNVFYVLVFGGIVPFAACSAALWFDFELG